MTANDRAYPPTVSVVDDARFDFCLLEDVARVLEEHGCPPVTVATDLHQLHLDLYRFLYAGRGRAVSTQSAERYTARPQCP